MSTLDRNIPIAQTNGMRILYRARDPNPTPLLEQVSAIDTPWQFLIAMHHTPFGLIGIDRSIGSIQSELESARWDPNSAVRDIRPLYFYWLDGSEQLTDQHEEPDRLVGYAVLEEPAIFEWLGQPVKFTVGVWEACQLSLRFWLRRLSYYWAGKVYVVRAVRVQFGRPVLLAECGDIYPNHWVRIRDSEVWKHLTPEMRTRITHTPTLPLAILEDGTILTDDEEWLLDILLSS